MYEYEPIRIFKVYVVHTYLSDKNKLNKNKLKMLDNLNPHLQSIFAEFRIFFRKNLVFHNRLVKDIEVIFNTLS
jgi:hypothetical protein